MAPVSGPELADLCGQADRDALTEFVADLYAARGYEVDRPAEGLLRLRPGGRTLTVRPTDGSPVPPGVDAVVTAGATAADEAAEGVDVVDAGTLREHLAYAVDREDARELLGEHFGVQAGHDGPGGQGGPVGAESREESTPGGPAPDRSTDVPPGGGRGDTPFDPRAWPRNRLRAVVAATGVFLLVGVLVGGVFVLSPAVGGTDDATSPGAPSPTPTETTETPTPSADQNGETPQHSADGSDTGAPDQYPPGVDSGGLADIDALIATHRSVLSNTSFTTTVRYSEFDDGRVTGVYVESVRVESRERYSVSVSSSGNLQTTPRAVVGADAFATENRTWVRLESNEQYIRSQPSQSRILGQLARYLRWSLSVESSTLRGQPSVEGGAYRVTTDGDPYGGIRDASGTVYVTGEGVVTYGRWTYTTVRPETRVEFSVETTGLGTTTAGRPDWPDAGEATNETGDGTGD